MLNINGFSDLLNDTSLVLWCAVVALIPAWDLRNPESGFLSRGRLSRLTVRDFILLLSPSTKFLG